MKDKIVIVDDTLKDREHLEKAFEGCGLGANVVSFKKIADAKTAILKSGEFPVAIVSDLDTQEGEKLESGKDFLEFEFDESVEQTGGGIWTILVSRHRTKLNEKVKYSHKRGIPRRHFYKDPGWARDCAALIAPLYAQSLPSDKQDALFGPLLPFDRNGELLNCLAPKDRIFLYSGGSSDFSRIKPHCPLVELPESFQRQSHARPIVMYRGHFVVVERNNAQNAAQLLLRWRIGRWRGFVFSNLGWLNWLNLLNWNRIKWWSNLECLPFFWGFLYNCLNCLFLSIICHFLTAKL